MAFTHLSNNYGYTGDWYINNIKDLQPGPTLSWFEHAFAPSAVFINHPDPWPKTRHHKRRIIQKDFAKLLVSRIKDGGFIKLASDKPDLAEWMRDILDQTEGLTNVAGIGGFIEREDERIHTKFEERGIKAGRLSQFLHYM